MSLLCKCRTQITLSPSHIPQAAELTSHNELGCSCFFFFKNQYSSIDCYYLPNGLNSHICSMLIELHLYKYFFLPDATLCFCSICYRPYVTFQSWFYSLAFASTQQIFIYTSYQLNEIPKMGKNDNNIIFSYFFVFRKSDGEIIIFASKCDIANEYFHILDITTQRFIFDTVF